MVLNFDLQTVDQALEQRVVGGLLVELELGAAVGVVHHRAPEVVACQGGRSACERRESDADRRSGQGGAQSLQGSGHHTSFTSLRIRLMAIASPAGAGGSAPRL